MGSCFYHAGLCLIANVLMLQTAETQYTLTVKTGLSLAAGTDAIIKIRLGAENGNYSTTIPLENNKNNFEHAATDYFTLKTKYLGPICQISVLKIDQGYFASWELDQMVLLDNVTSGKSVFKFNRWMGSLENSTAKIDGGWGLWTPWSACSQTCDGGQRVRSRKCARPPPACGGNICEGRMKETSDCQQEQCTTTTTTTTTTPTTTTAAPTTTTLPQTSTTLPKTVTTLPKTITTLLKTSTMLPKTTTTTTLPKTTTTTLVKTTTTTLPTATKMLLETTSSSTRIISPKPTRASKAPVIYANSKDRDQARVAIRFRLTLPPLPQLTVLPTFRTNEPTPRSWTVSTHRPSKSPQWSRRPRPRPIPRPTYSQRLRYPVEHRNPYPRTSATFQPKTSMVQPSTTSKPLTTMLPSPSTRLFNRAEASSTNPQNTQSSVVYRRRTHPYTQRAFWLSRTYESTTAASYRMNIAPSTAHIDQNIRTVSGKYTPKTPYKTVQKSNSVYSEITIEPTIHSKKTLARQKVLGLRSSKSIPSPAIFTTKFSSIKEQTTYLYPVKGKKPKMKSDNEIPKTPDEQLGVTIRSRVVQEDSPAYKSFSSTRSNKLPSERKPREENRVHLSVYVIVSICVSGVVVISVIIVAVYCLVVKSKTAASTMMSPPTITLQTSTVSSQPVSYPMTVQCFPR